MPHTPPAHSAKRKVQSARWLFALRSVPLAVLLLAFGVLPFIARTQAADSSLTTHHSSLSSRYSWLGADSDIYTTILNSRSAPTVLPSLLIPNATPQIITFAGYTGAGFQSTPTAGQLDSDDWAVTGWIDGDLAFGGTRTTASTDYTRGATALAVTTGGFYAFTGSPHSAADPAFMIQPGGGDWDPGTLTLRLENTGATSITQLQISYDIYNRNDQARSSSFNFSHSSDNTTYTSVGALDYASIEVGDGLGWVQVGTSPSRSTTITGLNIGPGGFYYVRWSLTNVSGSGSRDEFGLDNIAVTAAFTCPTSLTVNDTGDGADASAGDGICATAGAVCTLRAAIQEANALTSCSGAITINFNISGSGVKTFIPGSIYPAITHQVIIDGTTQAGSSCTTVGGLTIELNGASAGATGAQAGLQLSAGGSTVKGLVINRFGSYGLFLSSSSNTVQCNYIGTNVAGTSGLGNSNAGIRISGDSNVVGDTVAGNGNLVSGNSSQGIRIVGAGNQVLGNYVGVNAAGTAAIANGGGGVDIQNSANTTVGGTSAGARNVISGNTGSNGVVSANSLNTVVQGNYIGTDATGTTGLGNQRGVNVGSGASGNTIGGIGPGESNIIAFNSIEGVAVFAFGTTINNSVRGNSLHSNGGRGIDLNGDGVTGNDNKDPDGGPNNLQNFPVLIAPLVGATTVSGTLNSTVGATFTIDVYSNDTCDGSGNGEGKTHLGSVTTSATDSNGDVNFNVTVPAVVAGRPLTATATDANGNTSEFSACATPVTPSLLFRSKQNGDWNDFNTWETSPDGTTWTAATSGQTPTSADDTINIRNGHTVTVTASANADQATVDSGGTLVIDSGQTLTINDGTGTDLTIDGTTNVGSTGVIAGAGSVAVNGTIGVASTNATDALATNVTATFTLNTGSSTVNFNGAGGQGIGARNYYNLTFNNNAKTLANSGTIGIAGTFTPGTNTSHTTTNSTIEFNGASSQGVPVFHTYNNLTLNNTAGTTGASGLKVNNTLTVQAGTFSSASDYHHVVISSGGTLSLAGDVTVSGNWTNNGTFTHNGFNVTFDGDAANQTIGGNNSTTFRFLLISNTGPVNNNIVSLDGSLGATNVSAETLTITSGVFAQGTGGSSANFSTTGSGTVVSITGGKWQNVGTGDLTLSGNVSNAGIIEFNGNGTACGDNDDVSISSTGSARTWSGTGTFSMTDVTVANQSAGIPPITILVNSGTNAGGNTGWTFIDQCTAGTYTWIGGTLGANTDWQVATNWNPTRVAPAAGDILIFDGTATPAPIVTNVPTQTISSLQLKNSANAVQLNAALAGPHTLTITGNAGLEVQALSRLELQGSTGLTVAVTTGSASTINGQIALAGGPHQLTGANAGQIVFSAGTIFAAATGFTGNPFGTGTDGSVIFQSGSSAFFNAGSDPFGGAGNSIVTFNLGSSQEFSAASAFDSNGRTYGNLTLTGSSQAYTGSGNGLFTVLGDFVIGNLSTTLTLSGSAGGDMVVNGNWTDNSTSPTAFTSNGRTVTFSGASATQTISKPGAETFSDFVIAKTGGSVVINVVRVDGALLFNGTNDVLDIGGTLQLNGTVGGTNAAGALKGQVPSSALQIGGTGALGTLRFVSGGEFLTSLTVNRTSGGSVVLGTNLNVGNAFLGAVNLTNGVVDMGSNTLSLAEAPSMNPTNGYVIGNVKKTFGATGAFTFAVGTANGYSPVSVNVTAGTGDLNVKAVQGQQPNITGANALQRYWTLSGTGITADLTFNYLDPTDIPGTATESAFVIFKYDGSFATPGGTVNTGANTASISGVSSFSDWTLAEPAAVEEGTLQFSAANFNDNETNADHTATITVSRTGGTDGAVSVQWATSANTATVVTDYVEGSGTLNWADGEGGDKTFTVTVKGDTDFEPDELVNLTLSSPTGGATIGGTNPATLTIQDDDNTSPTITAAAGLTREQGSPSANSQIATVNDTESGANGVTVTVNGGASATVNGVTVSNIVNTNGSVTADIAADCSATPPNASFTLTATDGGGATATDTLTIAITANTPPVLTYSSPQTVAEGNALTINPATGPTDTGAYSIAVQDPGTYTGNIAVNNTTGVVAIANAAPVGSHTITIRITDACGFVDAQFTLDVNAAVCTSPPANMVAWYPGDGNANDIQGPTFENGTLQGGATFAPGKVNSGFSFDGADDHVSTSDYADLSNAGDQITVDAWIKRDTTGAGHYIASKWNANPLETGWYFAINGSNQLNFGVTLNGVYANWNSNTTLTDTTSFHHVAVTFEAGNAASIKVYLDGVDTPGSWTGNGNQVPGDTNWPVVIGAILCNNCPGPYFPVNASFDGIIDEVEIFNRQLDANEVAAIYNASFAGKCRECTTPPTDMVNWWPGEGNANDVGGTKNGSLQGGATASGVGRVGQAFDLPGSPGDVVNVPYASGFPNSSSGFTIDAWINIDSFDATADGIVSVVNTGGGGGANNIRSRLMVYSSSPGRGGITCGVKNPAEPYEIDFGVPNALFTNTWHHVACTVAPNSPVRLYVDGLLVGTDTTNVGATLPADVNNVYIGSGEQTTLWNADGRIDEVEIFNRALSQSEIAAIADAGNAGKCHTSVVTVDVAPASVAEDAAGNLVYTFRRSGDITTAVTVSFTIGGTASFSGNDYSQTGATTYDSPTGQGTLAFLAGEGARTVTIDPTPDAPVEPDETVVLTVTSGAGYVVGNPDTATGTITNDDATLTLVKTVVNDNGGTKVVSDFPLFIDGSPAASGTAAAVSANAVHTASETTQTGYAASVWGGDCAADGTITLQPGDNNTCTITNDDVAPTLTLVKTVVNDSGGSKVVSDFPLFINGNSVTSGTPNTLTANVVYTASETTQTGYAPSVWGGDCAADGTITLQPGDTKTCTITNDDILPTISINDVTLLEVDSGAINYVFTVSLSYSSTQTITVNYQTADDSATVADSDYTAVASTGITFDPGQTSKQVTIQVNGDTKFEIDEQFFVNLSGAVNATILDAQGVGAITNDDTEPTISIDDVTAFEGDSGTTDFNFTVSLSNASYLPISVTAQTANGTATTADADYNSAGPTILTFAAGTTSQPFQVQANGDTKYELDETFVVNLTAPSNATIFDPQGTGTISNDDAAPSLSINNLTTTEGTGLPLTKAFNFTVTKSGTTAEQATVTYQTADDTGGANPATSGADCSTPGVDYIASGGVVTFPASGAGSTSQTVTILVCRDSVFESNETFLVNLSGQVNATIADGQAVGTITNDDVPSGGFVVNTTADTVDDNLCLPIGSGNGCTLREAINAANASPAATAINFAIPADDARHFYYKDDGVPNQVTHDVTHVLVTTAANDAALPLDKDPDWPHSWWSILPTSALPTLTQETTVDGYTQTDAAVNTSATSTNAVLRIELEGSSAGVATTGLVVSNGSSIVRGLVINRFTDHGLQSSGAVNGNFIGTDVSGTLDLGNAGSGVLGGNNMIIGGSTPQLANLLSGNDSHGILFTNFNSSVVQGNYIGTKADGVSALGNSGNGIHLTGVSAVFNTIGGTAAGEANVIAFNGNDGVSLPDAGIGNAIRGNSIFSNGTTVSHLGIDLGPIDGLTANDVAPDADNGPNALQNFPVIQSAVVGPPHVIAGTLNSAVNQTFTIDVYANPTCDTSGNGEGKTYLGSTTTTTDANGLGGWRFVPATLNLSDQITATATSVANNTSEFSQCFTPRSFAAGQLQFTQTAISDAETNAGSHTVTFTVSRTGGTDRAASVNYTINDGTATIADNDYSVSSPTGTLQWPNGVAGDRTITITVNGDTKFELDETVQVVLSNPVGASLAGPDTATLTITNEDTQPTISIDDVTLNEGNAGTTNFNFTVSLSNLSYQEITVNAQTADGTAKTATSDYSVANTPVTIAPNAPSQTFTVQVNGDTIFENDETFFVNLSGANNATILDPQGAGTITNDDVCASFTTVYVDDDWVSVQIGDDPDAGGPATAFGCDSFATIQGGINGVQSGGTVIVFAGTYKENPLVNKAVTLQGPNVSVSGSGVRVAEAFVVTNGAQNAVFTVTASNVTVDGFTIDGDDPLVTGTTLKSGNDSNASHGITNHSPLTQINSLVVRNNIIKNFGVGVRLQNSGAVASMGSVFTRNWFDSIGNFDFGYAVNLRNSAYADITDNKMTRVWTGLHTSGSFNLAGPATWTMSGNEIHSYASGVDYWLQFGAATSLTLNNNQISAETGAVPNNFGILMVTIQNTINPTITNNTITGTDYGVGLTTTTTSNVITLGPTNSIVGTKVAGVLLTDHLNFNPVGTSNLTFPTDTSPIAVNITGLPITVASGTGVKIHNLRPSNPDVDATATISGATITGTGTNGLEMIGPMTHANMTTSTVTGFATGISLTNSSATPLTAVANFNRIISTTTAIDNPNNQTVDLEKNWWGCNAGPGNTGCGAVVGTGADFDPWIVLGVTASPTSVTPGGSSTITADMTDTSAGADSITNVPLPNASFSATNGNMLPTSNSFTSGQSQSTFTSTSSSAGSACATVDNQQICATVSITLPSFSISDATPQFEGNAGTTSFTFTVTKTGPGAASVNFQTQNGSATIANNDYQSNSGSLSFASSDTTKTITVLVNGDTAGELDETFNVLLQSPTDATISDGTGVGTILNDDETASAGQLIISEFRLSGPGANPAARANNEFIELYNATDQDVFVTTTDGSAGWAVATSSGVAVFHVPNGTIIPAREHFLGTNTSGYSLDTYPAGDGTSATGDATWTTDVPDNTALAVFRTNNAANFNTTNRLDSVGPNTETNTLYREGTGYSPLAPADLAQNLEHTFFRQICVFQAGCPTPGRPRDTQDNAADFIFADTIGANTSAGQRLGSPGPENLSSPIKRDPAVNLVLLDATVSDASAPNRVRNPSPSDPANASQFGTMTIRRRVVNQTGGTVTRLRFRVIDMTTHPSGALADLRLRSSSDQSAIGVNDSVTCSATGTPSGAPPPLCTVTVKGLTLEQPPNVTAANGGGLNTTVILPLPSGLADGQSINVQFLLGVQKTGPFRFYLVIEALP